MCGAIGASNIHNTLNALWYSCVESTGEVDESLKTLVNVISSAIATLNECLVSMTTLT